MSNTLVISVRLHEGWYHGFGSIPSPARMFQALVAGCGLSGPLPSDAIDALEWLENQEPPIVATPVTRGGQSLSTFVPNNDLDAKQGDFRRIGEIRTKKTIRPLLFDNEVPFMFCWNVNADGHEPEIRKICQLSDCVFQLGRAVDSAWAWAETLTYDELSERFKTHRGPILHPALGAGNIECPTAGSLSSLRHRYQDMSKRYALTADAAGQTFRRPAKPKWRMVSYQNPGTRICFDLVDRESSTLANWPANMTVELVAKIRDAAVDRLAKALPELNAETQQTLIGRKPNGENSGPISARIRILPLPSIGHEHADQQIRRVLVEIPGNCPLRADDVAWAFSGQSLMLQGRSVDLLRSQPHRQLEHYGISPAIPSRHWQTVTPIALTSATRRRIEPDKKKRVESDKKGAAERRIEQERAAAELRQALRHAGVTARLSKVFLQREPFSSRGERVGNYQCGDRFNKHSLWHAKLEFETGVHGPLVLGDGRFMGFGLLKPSQSIEGVFAFSIESGIVDQPDPVRLCKSLRRAVMARVQAVLGSSRLPSYFSGHAVSNAPADSRTEPHLSYVFDPNHQQLLIILPEVLDSSLKQHFGNAVILEQALDGFRELLAGPEGNLKICPALIDYVSNPLFASSRVWESVTPYCVNRHSKKTTATKTIVNDVIQECSRRNLPRPDVEVVRWCSGSAGLEAELQLSFKHVVAGPIILGKTRHHGGGLFGGKTND